MRFTGFILMKLAAVNATEERSRHATIRDSSYSRTFFGTQNSHTKVIFLELGDERLRVRHLTHWHILCYYDDASVYMDCKKAITNSLFGLYYSGLEKSEYLMWINCGSASD
jgi:hypothetical protein